MGKKPAERELRRQGAAILDQLRKLPVAVKLTKRQQQHLLDSLGTTPESVDELLSLETED